LVIQLKNQVNELEEVVLKNKTKEKEFSAEKQNLNLNNQIRKDKKIIFTDINLQIITLISLQYLDLYIIY
jgi:hypothetical protein